MRASAIVATLLCCAIAASAAAQDTHVLVITGVSGDDEHAQQFHTWAATNVDAARQRGGVPDVNITYLAEKPEQDPARIRGRSTKENVEKAFADIAAGARPNDEVFVLLIGHGSFDGRQSVFNLPGPDLSAADYATLLAAVPADLLGSSSTIVSGGICTQSSCPSFHSSGGLSWTRSSTSPMRTTASPILPRK